MVAAAIPLALGAFALSEMSKAIQSLYGMTIGINEFLNKHIEDMKGSENRTISRSGDVLEMAKLGFGIGFITPVIIISVGQLLLGNTLSAIGTVVTAPVNPIAMTCAAIGAIYFGWNALTDVERKELLEKLSKGLNVGIELIKSILRFVADTTKKLFEHKNYEEMKKYIGSVAAMFGKTLCDITHKFIDAFTETIDTLKRKSGEAYETVKGTAGHAADMAVELVDGVAGKLDNSDHKQP